MKLEKQRVYAEVDQNGRYLSTIVCFPRNKPKVDHLFDLPDDFPLKELGAYKHDFVEGTPVWDGGVILIRDVNEERDRRLKEEPIIHGGMEFDPSTYEIITEAMMAKEDGEDRDWILRDNTVVKLDPAGLASLASKASLKRTCIMVAARRLKDMSVIPVSYKDDTHWTGVQ